MATTSELSAIIEELELVDIGDAASYLGEEKDEMEKLAHENISLSFLWQYETLQGSEYSFH